MILKDYIANLQEICNKYPNLKVIYSSDEEGNNFEAVCYSPTVGKFKNGEFESLEDAEAAWNKYSAKEKFRKDRRKEAFIKKLK